MNQTIPLLIFGFLLGVKHAFDTDHVIAVSTMISEFKNPLKTALVGTFWGFGHTTTLFIVGLIILLLKISIPENVSLFFELMVGFMLILLGFKALLFRKLNLHQHTHEHNATSHVHFHLHPLKEHFHTHHKSFFIGVVHGLAGTGALMILVLSTVRSLLEGLYYILIFGIGSIIGMSLISLILGLPLIYSNKKFPQTEKYLRLITGTISIIFGAALIYEIAVVEGLLL